jgi:heterodisulfide reductase subunit A
MDKVGAVAVIGGGVSGIYAAHELAESGFKVYLIDESPTIGGRMLLLDKTFPTNDCAICILSPKMVEVARHPNIEILTLSEIVKVEGRVGNFKITLRQKPRYVTEKCSACGNCTNACPVEVPNEFERGLTWRKAIYIPIPQAIPTRYLIDRKSCLGADPNTCARCKTACSLNAIDYNQKEREFELKVGSIILACGAETYDPSLQTSYNYRHKNVITSMEFERLMNASGPTGGEIVKPSDGSKPKKIAFLQCVGSRDPSRFRELCSAVCCMYATKEAIVAKEHDPELDITIFFIDLRAHGKGFEEFTSRAKELGIKYVRCKDVEVKSKPRSDMLTLFYEDPDDNQFKSVDFDLVVLSVGLTPSNTLNALSSIMGFKLNKYGYVDTELVRPLETSIEGVYVCGCAQGPKDIPDCVAQACGAAAKAKSALWSVRNQLTVEKKYPPERKIEQKPRIGVFVCRCGVNIGGVVNVPEVVKYVKSLEDVVYCEENLHTCSKESQEIIKKAVEEHQLNRVIVAACTPRTHEPLFQSTLKEVGLNPYLFEFCNIREQCSWVHRRQKEKATEKAKNLIKMAVAKAKLLKPVQRQLIPVNKRVLVIGGGVSGMTASLDIAAQGFEVYLVEKGNKLGGFLWNIDRIQDGTHTMDILGDLIQKVENNPRITVMLESEIEEVEGHAGAFKAKVRCKEGLRELEFGAAVIAVGAKLLVPHGYYHFGKNEKIITQREMEQLLRGDFDAKTIVMIQCVGSREEKRPYCSRVCCTEAIKNAIYIKRRKPETEVFILYKDIRAYGIWETMYNVARSLGVLFIRYTDENRPIVDPENLTVTVPELLMNQKLTIHPDLLVLSSAIIPNEDNEKISRLFKVPLDQEGFFQEAHVKLRPVDFATDGVFVCGTAHYPKMIYESIAQASAVASRVTTFLSKGYAISEGTSSRVDKEKCLGCGLCESLCPFHAIKIGDDGIAEVIAATCKGCGICAASCPAKAIETPHFTDQQLVAQIDSAVVV